MTILADDRPGQHKVVCQSFIKSSNHNIVNSIGQHIGVIDQSKINSSINHVLQFTRIGIKSKLPRHRQILLLDNFPAPVHTEGFQAKLPVFLHNSLHGLLLFISEISFCHSNDIVCVELSSSHVDLVDILVPLGLPKDMLMQKLIYKHKGLIPYSNFKACQSI